MLTLPTRLLVGAPTYSHKHHSARPSPSGSPAPAGSSTHSYIPYIIETSSAAAAAPPERSIFTFHHHTYHFQGVTLVSSIDGEKSVVRGHVTLGSYLKIRDGPEAHIADDVLSYRPVQSMRNMLTHPPIYHRAQAQAQQPLRRPVQDLQQACKRARHPPSVQCSIWQLSAWPSVLQPFCDAKEII